MAGALLWNAGNPAAMPVLPVHPPTDIAVAPNFERFDGLDVPNTNPATQDPHAGGNPGADYGWDKGGVSPRPGNVDQPNGQVYTAGPLKGLTGTLGGQPLPVNDWKYRGRRAFTPGKTHSIQNRLGDGQANQGAAQTVILSEITGNPPVPGDLSGIIAGQA